MVTFGFNRSLFDICVLTLEVSDLGTLLAAALALPSGAWVALTRHPLRRWVFVALYTGMALPPVGVGLLVYLVFSRSGSLGSLNWLFTPVAMTIAQAVIAFPVIGTLTGAALIRADGGLRLQLLALGATRLQILWTLLREARSELTLAIAAGFGGAVSEVGAVFMVGGDIPGETRVLTTAIVVATRQGYWAVALVLGGLLLGLALLINAGLVQPTQADSADG